MTEAEWLTCTDPAAMLEFLTGKASTRKLRLFGCACCRLVWDRHEGGSRRAVEVSERFADGAADLGELRKAHQAVEYQGKSWYYAHPAWYASSERPEWAWAYGLPYDEDPGDGRQVMIGNRAHYLATHSNLLHEVFGNPFARIGVEPSWLTWNAGIVPELATGIYEERSPLDGAFTSERLAALADALEEAGCQDARILAHCRGPGPHVRGCWVVDLILGKE